MIRVRKSVSQPHSLSSTKAYDGEDVKRQLDTDQYNKCYLCERVCGTDFLVEHLRSQENYPRLIQSWDNLLLGCSYCNGKKSDAYDNILNPLTVNVEDEIEQRIDLLNKQSLFVAVSDDDAHRKTVELLSRLHNGTKHLRNTKEEHFIEYIIAVVNDFRTVIQTYQSQQNPQTEKAVREELGADKELLGFKYLIIKDNPELYAVFGNDMVWNKQQPPPNS